jgi:hypothetical protein
MNIQTILPRIDPAELERRRTLTGILEYAVASLELTPQQRNSIESTYREVGHYLAKALGADDPDADIFAQGSYKLGTVIRPWRDITEFFDLDIVFHFKVRHWGQDAKKYRDAIGAHLREKYREVLKPLAKGWRLDYSKERGYYLDIIPAMTSAPDEVIAITIDAGWKDTNPRGYAAWFEAIAAILPDYGRIVLANEARMNNRNATIEPLPEHTDFKGPLKRVTQVTKRHRDYYFNRKTRQGHLAPSSIVVTTLLALAYQGIARAQAYQSGYDLLVACVEGMVDHLMTFTHWDTNTSYSLDNPSLISENLVAKWNDDPQLGLAFFEWHADFVEFLRKLPEAGVPQRRLLTETFGEGPVNAAFQKQADTLNTARNARLLSVAPTVGLTTSAGLAVPRHVIDGIE